uniref:lysozyme n=1 Tax=Plectus sambesii TaxID=2011161 RepID=A0A914VNN9_9BILA
MCQLESRGCNAIGCNWDAGSLSCGYFQIKLAYYQDCGEPWKQQGESTEQAWQRCGNNWDCSVQCIHNYMNRYGGNCPGRSDCERMARIHNGGPYGCNSGTDWYWNKISQCMG